MVFRSFGAPLYESFQNENTNENVVNEEPNNGNSNKNVNSNKTINGNKKVNGNVNNLVNLFLKLSDEEKDNLMKRIASSEEDEDDDDDGNEVDDDGKEVNDDGEEEDDDGAEDDGGDDANDDANDGEDDANDGEDDANNGEDGEDEPFVGTEGFVGNRNMLDIKVFLKALLFSCLFYLLAHNDTRNMILKVVKIGNNNYLYLAMVLFFVCYLLLNMIV